MNEIVGDINMFLDKIFSNIEKAGFDFGDLVELDHIGYRVENNERYKIVKLQLREHAEGLSEVVFGGRLISVFKLQPPIEYKNYKVAGFELLAPKEGNKFREGLEHAEFVTGLDLADFHKKYKKSIDFNLEAYAREDNPELIVEFDECAVKLHNQSLLKIRGLE